MEESAPKRRRISPTVEQQASPSEIEAHANADATTAGGTNRAGRPSFASPTKSSMARYHSQILERRRSSSPTKSSPTRQPPQRLTTDPEQVTVDVDDASRDEREYDDNASADSDAQPSTSSPTSTRPSLAAAPRRSPAKPSPRPLPAPTPHGEEDLNPFIGHTLRRSPKTGVPMPRRPEPELPPSVPDAVSSTPPRGIHSSSPSRWREKKRRAKQSPLKAPPLRPNEGEEVGFGAHKGSRQLFTDGKTAAPTQPGSNLNRSTDAAALTASEQAGADLRNVSKNDSNSKRRQAISQLQAEIRQLQADLKIIRRESGRQQAAQRSGRVISLGDEGGSLGMIERHLMGENEAETSTVSHTLARTALAGSGFKSLLQLRPQKAVTPVAGEVLIRGIKSHHPVSMAAKEEIMFLQLFSPFEITSNIDMLPASEEQICRQRHRLTLRSRDRRYRGLFTARIEIITNVLSQSIFDLRIQGLEPTARPELEEFAQKICEGDCNRSMQRNIGILTWAMAEWVRVARRRAKLWYWLERRLSREDSVSSLAQAARQRDAIDQMLMEGDEEMPLKDMLRLVGKQSLTIACPAREGAQGEASLRFRWRIEFTWTGDATSTTDVTLGVPGNWISLDRSGALGKLPVLFGELIGGGEEPEVAARSLSALFVSVHS